MPSSAASQARIRLFDSLRLLLQPGGHCLLHCMDSAAEKMIRAGNQNQSPGFGSRSCQLLQALCRREWILVSAKKKFGERARAQMWIAVTAAVGMYGQPEQSQRADILPCVPAAAARAQCHGRAKAEARCQNWPVKFVLEPRQRRFHIGGFGGSIVRALAQAGPAKIEAQNRCAKSPLRRVQYLHGVVHHLVMHGSAAQRVRMANQSHKRRSGSALVQHRLQPSSRAPQIDAALEACLRTRIYHAAPHRWSYRKCTY